MIDHAGLLARTREIQENQAAAQENGHVVTIRVEKGETGPLLYIEANLPIRVEVEGDYAAWFMEGGAVSRYPDERRIAPDKGPSA